MVIKAAEKCGAVVVWWADLNQKEASNFPTPPFMQESTKISLSSQNIVKNTIDDLIAKQDLPATAKILTITTPRTSCIYFLPKIHKPNNPGRPSFLPTVVPMNLLPAHI